MIGDWTLAVLELAEACHRRGVTLNSIHVLDDESDTARVEVTFPGDGGMTSFVEGFDGEGPAAFFERTAAEIRFRMARP